MTFKLLGFFLQQVFSHRSMCISTIHVRLLIICWQDSRIQSGHTSVTLYDSALTQPSQESALLDQLLVN